MKIKKNIFIYTLTTLIQQHNTTLATTNTTSPAESVTITKKMNINKPSSFSTRLEALHQKRRYLIQEHNQQLQATLLKKITFPERWLITMLDRNYMTITLKKNNKMYAVNVQNSTINLKKLQEIKFSTPPISLIITKEPVNNSATYFYLVATRNNMSYYIYINDNLSLDITTDKRQASQFSFVHQKKVT